MKTKAAVLVELDRPLVLADLEIPALLPGQALVELKYSGVCHTQVLEARGRRGEDRFLPHCLGHEGSGVVVDIGPGVRKVQPGQSVILSWIKGSGADVPGTQYRWDGRVVNAGAVTTFGRHAVLSENRLTLCSDGLDLRYASLVGCAVPTGVGVIFNSLQPSAGSSLAVFGVGGVGAYSLAAAATLDCRPLIAIDRVAARLEIAKSLGATDTILVNDDCPDPAAQLLRMRPQGLDFAVEATGVPAVMEQALRSVRPRGGAAIIVGNARHGSTVTFDPRQFNQGKRLLGSWGGESDPDRDYPRYCRLIAEGKLPAEQFLTKTYSLDEINTALDELERGEVLRPLIKLGD